jgi:hypothetical protein
VGVTLSSAISGKSSVSLPESLVSDDGVVIEVCCDMLCVIKCVMCVDKYRTSRERFGNLVFVNLVFSCPATLEFWVAMVEGEKWFRSQKKS